MCSTQILADVGRANMAHLLARTDNDECVASVAFAKQPRGRHNACSIGYDPPPPDSRSFLSFLRSEPKPK
jgi:hypothetical protein